MANTPEQVQQQIANNAKRASQLISQITPASIGSLAVTNNLSDLGNISTAQTNLGLGTMATQNANAVNISGGTAALTSLSVTNVITGSVSGNAATVTTNANLTGPITSSGNATSIASQTGTGSKIVVDTSPTLITPILGVASATSINFGGNALNTYSTGSWTPVLNGFTAVGAVTVSGTYVKVGVQVTLYFIGFASTSLATTNGSSFVSGLPYAPVTNGFVGGWCNGFSSAGNGINVGSSIYPPTIGATSGAIYATYTYIASS